jgi:hypothetical protein
MLVLVANAIPTIATKSRLRLNDCSERFLSDVNPFLATIRNYKKISKSGCFSRFPMTIKLESMLIYCG